MYIYYYKTHIRTQSNQAKGTRKITTIDSLYTRAAPATRNREAVIINKCEVVIASNLSAKIF